MDSRPQAIRAEPMPVTLLYGAHKFALRAFEVHAVDYLLKPFDRERFDRLCSARPTGQTSW
jgi:DNA-binding LytR/AlgR family response regulator